MEEEEKLKAQKHLELESKIEELKKENEEYKKHKLEKEAELEKLKEKLKLVSSQSADPQQMNMNFSINYGPTGGFSPYQSPQVFPSPSLEMMQYYSTQPFYPFPAYLYPNSLQTSNLRPSHPVDPNSHNHPGRRVSTEPQNAEKSYSDEMSLDLRRSPIIASKFSPSTTSNRVQFKSSFYNNELRRMNLQQRTVERNVDRQIKKAETAGAGVVEQIVSDLRSTTTTRSKQQPSIQVIDETEDFGKTHSNVSSKQNFASGTSIENDFNNKQANSLKGNTKPEEQSPPILKGGTSGSIRPTEFSKFNRRRKESADSIKTKKETGQKIQWLPHPNSAKFDKPPQANVMNPIVRGHQQSRIGQRRFSGPIVGATPNVFSIFRKESTDFTAIDSKSPQKHNPGVSKLDLDQLLERSLSKGSWKNGLPHHESNDSIQEDGPISLRPIHILHFPNLFTFLESSEIKQAYFGIDDGNNYTIECHFIATIEPKVKFVLCQEGLLHSQIAEETIRIKDLGALLNFVDFRDALPPSITLKSIKTYKSFVRYFIIPFLWVNV